MLPRCLLLYFLSFSLAAETAAKADYPASDLRKLSEEDLLELDEFLSRVQQVLHPKDTVVDKLESVQAPFARLVAKLANVPPVKPLHRLTRKVRNGDDAFVAQDEVAAAADSLLADQRESYLSMRLILDALFGMEDVESDAESGSDTDDSDSDDEEDGEEEEGEDEDEGEEEELDDGDDDAGDDDAGDGEAGEGEAGEGETGEGDDAEEGEEEDLDDYDWFYRIFGSKSKGARAAVDKAPGVASLELAALAKRSLAVNRAVNRGVAQRADLHAKPGETSDAKSEPSALIEPKPESSTHQTSKHAEPTPKSLTVPTPLAAPAILLSSQTTSVPALYSKTVKTSATYHSSSVYVEEPKSVATESFSLTLVYAAPEETPQPETAAPDQIVPEETVPEESVPVIFGPEESAVCNLTFGNWSWACAPTSSGSARSWSVALVVAVSAATLFAIFLV